MAAVSSGFLGQGLHGSGLQGNQLLGIFDRQQSVGVLGRLVQSGFAGGEVQLDHFFNTLEGFVGQAEQHVELGFLGSGDLVNGQHG